MTETLAADGRVTDAIYDAGYSGPGRFYAEAKDRLRDDSDAVARRRTRRDDPLGNG